MRDAERKRYRLVKYASRGCRLLRMPRALTHFILPAYVVAALLGGCSNEKAPTRVEPGPPFVADSPIHLLRLVEWSFENLDEETLKALFTSDYQFEYPVPDTSGNDYRDVSWFREDELISAHHLFVGGGALQPRATSIKLTMDLRPNVAPDPRPGKMEPWHQTIRTGVVLTIRTVDGQGIEVIGHAEFFMTRGDSATVPSPLPADSSRWYIDRWEDQTAQGGALVMTLPRNATPEDAQPASNKSWGALKALYR